MCAQFASAARSKRQFTVCSSLNPLITDAILNWKTKKQWSIVRQNPLFQALILISFTCWKKDRVLGHKISFKKLVFLCQCWHPIGPIDSHMLIALGEDDGEREGGENYKERDAGGTVGKRSSERDEEAGG